MEKEKSGWYIMGKKTSGWTVFGWIWTALTIIAFILKIILFKDIIGGLIWVAAILGTVPDIILICVAFTIGNLHIRTDALARLRLDVEKEIEKLKEEIEMLKK